MKASAVHPDQSRPWKNSFFRLPKNPSQAALSGEWPLRDMDLASPWRPHMAFHPGQR